MQAPRIVRSSRTLSRIVIGGLAVGILVDLVSLVHDLSGSTLIERFQSGAIGQADLVAWDDAFATIGLAQTAALVLTAIVWLVWQYRIVATVEPLTHEAPVKTPGRSVLWWFVPFANLVVVPRIYADLKDKFAFGSGSIVGQWFGLYLLSNLVTNFAARLWGTVDDAAGFKAGINLWIASDALSILAAIVAIRLILRLQGGQDALLAAPPPLAINTLEQAVAPTEAS